MSTRDLPPGYVEIGTWTPSKLTGRDWIVLFVAFAILAYASLQTMAVSQLVFVGADSFTISLDTIIGGIALGAVLGVTLHELAHAIAFLAYGGRPRFGFKLWTRFGPVFWVGAPGCYLSRAKFAVAGLAPLLLLTALLLPVLFLAPVGGLVHAAALWAFFLGVTGSSGDVVILSKVMRYPSEALFEDHGDGFKVYSKQNDIILHEANPSQP